MEAGSYQTQALTGAGAPAVSGNTIMVVCVNGDYVFYTNGAPTGFTVAADKIECQLSNCPYTCTADVSTLINDGTCA